MPVPKRWMPVSRDINDDGQGWQFTDQFGDRALRTWLEILSILDKTENSWRCDFGALAAVARKVRQTLATVQREVGWMLASGWLEVRQPLADGSPGILRAPKYAKYHKTPEPEKVLSDPTQPSDLPIKSKKREDNTSPLTIGEAVYNWPSPEALIALYNAESADELPAVTQLSEARKKKCKAYLKQFPESAWWQEVFKETRLSRFLRGLQSQNGHEGFKGDLDWLLTKGKDGTENAVKTYEGRYRDGKR